MSIRPSPSIDDLIFKQRLLQDIAFLEPYETHAVIAILNISACRQVWTYSEPRDGGIPVDDVPKLIRIPKSRWNKIKAVVCGIMDVVDGKIYPPSDWMEITVGTRRPQVSGALRAFIGKRDDWTCGYCGTREGPFDIDHIVPVIAGGAAEDAANLICSCSTCNRSKGAKPVAEWVSGGRANG